MSVPNAQLTLTNQVTGWDGVTSGPHRFGGLEWQYQNTEIGHIHGDHLVDIPFPTHVRDELVAAGRAQLHHIYPQMGWVSLYLNSPEDVTRSLELLRMSYDLIVERKARLAQHIH